MIRILSVSNKLFDVLRYVDLHMPHNTAINATVTFTLLHSCNRREMSITFAQKNMLTSVYCKTFQETRQ